MKHELDSHRYAPSTDQPFHPLERNARFIEWIGRDKTVLELGCSTGFISKHLAANGCRVLGVEYDFEMAIAARDFCDEVIVTDLNCETWVEGIRGRHFDVIAAGDVLEHLLDPSAVLKACREHIAPSGKLIVCLPNVAYIGNRLRLLRGQWTYTDKGILDRTHLKFFTVETARSMLQEAGYIIEEFYPAGFGANRGSTRFPATAQKVANRFPGLLGYQLLFSCKVS